MPEAAKQPVTPKPVAAQQPALERGSGSGLIGRDEELLKLLEDRKGNVVTREEIGMGLWPELMESGLADRVMDESIERIRAHVGDDPVRPAHIISAGNAGFLMV